MTDLNKLADALERLVKAKESEAIFDADLNLCRWMLSNYEDILTVLRQVRKMREAMEEIAKPCGDMNNESRDHDHQQWANGYEQGWETAQDIASAALKAAGE